MIIWITTVGWSPFAVINPIWAYCKENEKTPDKLFLLHTENMKVLRNLGICEKYLNEILREYSNNNFKEDNLIRYQIKNETYEIYSLAMKKIIERELIDENAKIIIDMTPGRKYMSAINMFFGLKALNNTVQVLYLYLEEAKYQKVPYPLTPVIKNELIDIIESAEIFSKDFIIDKAVDPDDNIIKNITAIDILRKFLILRAIAKDFNTITKIKKYFLVKKQNIRSIELRQILKELQDGKYVSITKVPNKKQNFFLYKNLEKADKFIHETLNQYKVEADVELIKLE